MSDALYDLVNETSRLPLFLLCEHGGNAIPSSYKGLGIAADILKAERNILFDTGAASVTRHVAAQTKAGALIGRYSRLLVDLNRLEDSVELIPPSAHGYEIPGNANLSMQERKHRIETYYRAFHEKAEEEISKRLHEKREPTIFSIHSYTPRVGAEHTKDKTRSMPDIGLLYVTENALLDALRQVLKKYPHLTVADNFPYDIRKFAPGSLHRHGIAKGLPSLAVEISIDRLKTPEDEKMWGDILAEACRYEEKIG